MRGLSSRIIFDDSIRVLVCHGSKAFTRSIGRQVVVGGMGMQRDGRGVKTRKILLRLG